jgi:hypothetical protein
MMLIILPTGFSSANAETEVSKKTTKNKNIAIIENGFCNLSLPL